MLLSLFNDKKELLQHVAPDSPNTFFVKVLESKWSGQTLKI